MTPTFDYQPARDGLALQTGGPLQAGYRADGIAHPTRLWQPRFPNETSPKGHSNPWNGEYQFYADPEYAWKGGFSPFAIVDGALRIRAQRSDGIAAAAGELPENPATRRPYDWVSGVLSSRQSFSQQGGYFEITAKMPRGASTWPAFWLLPVNEDHPPELDVVEYLGREPTRYRATCISLGPVFHATTIQAQLDLSEGVHRYGMMWTDTAVTFYLDDAAVACTSIVGRREYWQKFYLIVNLAIGSNKKDWVPAPDLESPSPADLMVQRVRAWQRRGPREVVLSGSSVEEGATLGSVVAKLSCVTDESQPSIAFRLSDSSTASFAIVGASLVTRTAISLMRAQSHQLTIEAEDSHGRRWRQPVSIVVLDAGSAPNALAPDSQGNLLNPAWKTVGTRVGLASDGNSTQLLLEEENSAVHAVEQLIPKAQVAQRYLVSADLASHGRRFVKLEVSRNYGKNVQAVYDLEGGEVSGQTASPDADPFRLNDCYVTKLRNGFCRCAIDLMTDRGPTLRVAIKLVTSRDGREASSGDPGAGVRSGAFFRVVKLETL